MARAGESVVRRFIIARNDDDDDDDDGGDDDDEDDDEGGKGWRVGRQAGSSSHVRFPDRLAAHRQQGVYAKCDDDNHGPLDEPH